MSNEHQHRPLQCKARLTHTTRLVTAQSTDTGRTTGTGERRGKMQRPSLPSPTSTSQPSPHSHSFTPSPHSPPSTLSLHPLPHPHSRSSLTSSSPPPSPPHFPPLLAHVPSYSPIALSSSPPSVMSVLTRSVSLFFLTFSFCIALAALTADGWVVDRNVRSYSQHVDFGLQSWEASWTSASGAAVNTGSQSYTSALYSQLGLDVYLDAESHWKSAGMAALALGALGVAFTGIAALVVLHSLIRPTSTSLSTFPSFLAGFCFILGAVLYEGIRPSFHGDIGYEWPFGLYVTSGILSDMAAYTLHAGSGSDVTQVIRRKL